MARQGCTACRGAGSIKKEKKNVTRVPQPDGSWKDHVETVTVMEKCGACGGSGWVNQ